MSHLIAKLQFWRHAKTIYFLNHGFYRNARITQSETECLHNWLRPKWRHFPTKSNWYYFRLMNKMKKKKKNDGFNSINDSFWTPFLKRLSILIMDILLNGLSTSAKRELLSLCCIMGKTMPLRCHFLAANG